MLNKCQRVTKINGEELISCNSKKASVLAGFHFLKCSGSRLGHLQPQMVHHQEAGHTRMHHAPCLCNKFWGERKWESTRLLSQILGGDLMPLPLNCLMIFPLSHGSTRVWGQKLSSLQHGLPALTSYEFMYCKTSREQNHL